MGEPVKLYSGEGQKRMNEWRETVEEVEQRGKGLTPWENSFLESIGDQLTQGRPLTERQSEILGRIRDEKCP